MSKSDEFSDVMKHGRKSGGRAFVVFTGENCLGKTPGHPYVGLIVSKQVGNAVRRNRLKRQIRHWLKDSTTTGERCWVVRVLPGVNKMSDAEVLLELERTMTKAITGRQRKVT